MNSRGLLHKHISKIFIIKTIGERLLRLPEVLEMVTFRETTPYAFMGKGFFPQNIKLGSNMFAWVASEVEGWTHKLKIERKPDILT